MIRPAAQCKLYNMQIQKSMRICNLWVEKLTRETVRFFNAGSSNPGNFDPGL